MAREIEAKIRVPDLTAIHARLLGLGASDEGVVFERNWIFDDANNSLAGRGVLLRVRSHGGAGGILTVKHRVDGGAFKTREEVESMFDSTDDLLRQLEMLGYHIGWIYEKRRRTMLWRDCVFALDECPEIGSFVEIEGNEDSIRDACGKVGLDPESHIDDNYLGLWRKHLEANGEQPRHMTFARDEIAGGGRFHSDP